MSEYVIHARAPGKIVMVGFGAIGQGVLPLILRHLDVKPSDITIVTADERGHDEAREYGIRFIDNALTRSNYRQVLQPLLAPGNFLVNLSVDVSSIALVELCQEFQTLYIDTCIEPWAGGYTDPSLSLSERSNYAIREQALALRQKYPQGSTAIFANGANPGMVSHLLKQALLNLHRDIHGDLATPSHREEWAALARKLGIKMIHVAERDTQITDKPKQMNEFVNTWSVDGFVGEGCQPAELGWGTHEKQLPVDGANHEFGCGAAIYLKRPGATVRVRTWTPDYGPFHGFLITHNEAISIADYLTVRERGADGQDKVVYRPTCHYAYHPCDSAIVSLHEYNGRNFVLQPKQRILRDEIIDGMDELGVLLAGHAKGAYWFGSQLTAKEAKKLAPYNSATSLQVTSAVLAGMVWAIENPNAGIVEAEDMDFARNLEVQAPYLGKLVGAYTDWTPLQQRNQIFAEDVDASDPWQFSNVRVV